MTFRMHDDSSPFVSPFAIDRKQPDYQRPENRHRDHGLVLLNPQNGSAHVIGSSYLRFSSEDYRIAEAASGKTMFLASAYPAGMLALAM